MSLSLVLSLKLARSSSSVIYRACGEGEAMSRDGTRGIDADPCDCEIVSRIALVKPDRARAIEQLLMRMAQSGQLRGRVSEDQLIDVLDQVSFSKSFLSSSPRLSFPESRERSSESDIDQNLIPMGVNLGRGNGKGSIRRKINEICWQNHCTLSLTLAHPPIP